MGVFTCESGLFAFQKACGKASDRRRPTLWKLYQRSSTPVNYLLP